MSISSFFAYYLILLSSKFIFIRFTTSFQKSIEM
jgi:hypothetical protein